MDKDIQQSFDNLQSNDADLRYQAYLYLHEVTENPVNWAYEVWDDLVADFKHKNNHRRAIATQLIVQLAKSDPDQLIFNDFPKLMEVTKDEKFVTARHTIQALWKVGIESKEHQQLVLNHTEQRFKDCEGEKNHTLIRYDLIVGLRNLYNEVEDEEIKERAEALMELETDEKYQKKYKKEWK
ncbi:hypothetical protein [Halalkalibacillus halophilus]|uniref:hypothetical protein n=1 Tax=Halalkalibacillus halophilus TaxID=392827 RepID=UPI00040F8578|nr:hypothetical protein [Halalkalibacillus halophilus]